MMVEQVRQRGEGAIVGLYSSDSGDSSGDRDIVESAASGSQDAWDVIVNRHAGTVWEVARRLLPSGALAVDVSRLTWMRLRDRLDVIAPDAIGSWLEDVAEREAARLILLTESQEPGEVRAAWGVAGRSAADAPATSRSA
jgi:hypothetical protein